MSLSIGRDNYSEKTMRGPTIEHGAMIGAGAILLTNTVIGARAVVAAGSVVTKDVKPGSMVVGVPAKFIKAIEIH